eukprot:TRINITY_DN10386_c0_g1_i2.p1 TRINITY_DN10386_c0_g1~~TRINITY_DN10386_c0_g1_i2.p1  ORF type:complete len:572 (-),score=163.12 TRINITY_DN10386_c0_g1_i2:87-1802(-)
MQRAYTIYLSENIKYGRQLLSWKEIALQNIPLSVCGIVRFLQEADIVPTLVNIEDVEDILMKIMPPTNPKEHGFYHDSVLMKVYEKELYLSANEPHFDGDPRMHFHEFAILLGRIAIETIPKEKETEDKKRPDVAHYVNRFLGEIICLRKNTDQKKAFSSLNLKFLKRMADHVASEERHTERGEHEEAPQQQDLEQIQKQMNKMVERQNAGIINAPPLTLNLSDVLLTFERELPAVPFPVEKKFAAEPLNLEKVVTKKIGLQPPKEEDKNKKAPKPPPRPNLNKDKKPQKPVIFEMPAPQPPQASEEIYKYRDDLEGRAIISGLKIATFSNIEVKPTLIKEVLYPEGIPPPVLTFMESALIMQNHCNFYGAIKNYETARDEWESFLKPADMPPELNLFFEFVIGQVYETAGRDDYALGSYISSKNYADQLPSHCVDKALPYLGIGSVLYHTSDYEWALRCFLKAKEIREDLIGSDTVDTATVYNNIGCCFYCLDRHQESFSYLNLAVAIFQAELGQFHHRTLSAHRNLMKAKKIAFVNLTERQVPWEAYPKAEFPIREKVKKEKKAKPKKK